MVRLVFALQLLPIPGLNGLSQSARLALAVVLSVPLALSAPLVPAQAALPEAPLFWLCEDAAAGLFVGTLTVILFDALALLGQLVATMSGFTYGATIDPLSDVDSGLLPTVLGLSVAAAFYASPLFPSIAFLAIPRSGNPGLAAALPGPHSAMVIGAFAQHCCTTALCLALPIALLALITDVACALIARHLPHLQLLMILLGVKPALVIVLLAVTLPAMAPSVVRLIEEMTTLLKPLGA
jgi:flagellar biosynthetic protein FliR